MAKRHKKHEEHMDESWLLPYSDLMTLLLALFIVLAASSTTDQIKLQQMAEVFQSFTIGGGGIMTYTAPEETKESPDSPMISEEELKRELKERLEKSKESEMENLEVMQREINAFIKEKGLALSLQTKLTENGLLITISDTALFDSGSAAVKNEAIPLAKQISTLIFSDPPREIWVSGHTDNVPISTSTFRSNWELSAIRSINFLNIMLENKQHNPLNFSAIGHGEYRPIADNKTEKGRQENRRVEVLILPREVEL